ALGGPGIPRARDLDLLGEALLHDGIIRARHGAEAIGEGSLGSGGGGLAILEGVLLAELHARAISKNVALAKPRRRQSRAAFSEGRALAPVMRLF
ncbi:MAG TPA: hypothetical protein VGM87_19115, partial [Roseomonas sp.]